jgi:hypothetical protein
MLPRMKASGFARSSATMVWLRLCPVCAAIPDAIPDNVWPARTGASSVPAATATGARATGAGIRAGSGEGAGAAADSVTTASGVPVAPVDSSATSGGAVSAGRTMTSDGTTSGAWIGGCSGAATVCGESTSAEYSRTSLPCPQSTSTRKVNSGSCTGSTVVMRITGRPCGSSAMANCRSATRPAGGSSPIRRKVSGDASRACSCSSSDGSLDTIGISASNGWPCLDLTSIWPRPSANAGPQASASSRIQISRIGMEVVVPGDIPTTLAARHHHPQCSRCRRRRRRCV